MPCAASYCREKEYCDLLYAWLQCNSERENVEAKERRIEKKCVKWTKIESDFTRKLSDGTEEKVMTRKTIAKYFSHLMDKKLVVDKGDNYYYLALLDRSEANLIEYNTLSTMMNVFQKNSISIYIYLFNRYCANGYQPFIATIAQIKEHIGIATSTTSNNLIVDNTIEILKRLGLLDVKMVRDDIRTYLEFQWVRNELPKK